MPANRGRHFFPVLSNRYVVFGANNVHGVEACRCAMVFAPPPVALLSPVASPIDVGGWAWVVVAAVIVWGAPVLVRWLWNLTFPRLAQWPTVDYWSAFRLVILMALVGLIARFF